MRWIKSKQPPKKPTPPRRPSPPRRNSSKAPFAIGDDESDHSGSATPAKRPLPPDAVDLVTEDLDQVEEARVRGRMRGEPQKTAPAHVYVHHDPDSHKTKEVEEVHDGAEDVTSRRRDSESLAKEDVPGAELIQKLETVREVSHAGRTYVPSTTPYDENPWA